MGLAYQPTRLLALSVDLSQIDLFASTLELIRDALPVQLRVRSYSKLLFRGRRATLGDNGPPVAKVCRDDVNGDEGEGVVGDLLMATKRFRLRLSRRPSKRGSGGPLALILV